MSWVSALELCGCVFAVLALWLTAHRKLPLPREALRCLTALLATVGVLHVLDVIEWFGVPEADWLGDTLKVAVPVAWLAFLFAVTRAELSSHLEMADGQVRLLIGETPAAIAVVDEAGNCLLANEPWRTLHECHTDVLGKPLALTSGRWRDHWQAVINEALTTNTPRFGRAAPPGSREAQSGICQWSVRPWVGPQGERGAIVVVMKEAPAETTVPDSEDNRERSKALEELGVAASGVAHDINNLLTVISMHSEVLHLMKGQDPEVMKSSLQSIQQAIGTASSMTRGLLLFSKLKPLELELVDLTTILRGSLRLLEDLLQDRAQLVIQADSPVWVRANPSALQQILLNLVINARDAIGVHGTISLRAELTPSGPMLAVEDTGSGIPREVLDHIFEPFFTTKNHKGTGLGLAVVDRLARAQQARVEVHSTVGSGTKFTLWFPPVAFTLVGSSIRSASRGPS